MFLKEISFKIAKGTFQGKSLQHSLFAHSFTALKVSRKFSILGTKCRISSVTRQPEKDHIKTMLQCVHVTVIMLKYTHIQKIHILFHEVVYPNKLHRQLSW